MKKIQRQYEKALDFRVKLHLNKHIICQVGKTRKNRYQSLVSFAAFFLSILLTAISFIWWPSILTTVN